MGARRLIGSYHDDMPVEPVHVAGAVLDIAVPARSNRMAGMTPKRAAQLIRFDHAAHRLAGGHSPATVAAEGGYTDQSHLYREVMAFAGLTPTAIAHAPWLEVDPVAWSAPRP